MHVKLKLALERSNRWITNWQTNFSFWSQSCATPSTACSHSPSSFSYLMGQLIATATVIYVICSALYDFKIVVDLLLFNSWHPQLYYWKILVNILKLPHAYSTYIVPLLYTLCALLEYFAIFQMCILNVSLLCLSHHSDYGQACKIMLFS